MWRQIDKTERGVTKILLITSCVVKTVIGAPALHICQANMHTTHIFMTSEWRHSIFSGFVTHSRPTMSKNVIVSESEFVKTLCCLRSDCRRSLKLQAQRKQAKTSPSHRVTSSSDTNFKEMPQEKVAAKDTLENTRSVNESHEEAFKSPSRVLPKIDAFLKSQKSFYLEVLKKNATESRNT